MARPLKYGEPTQPVSTRLPESDYKFLIAKWGSANEGIQACVREIKELHERLCLAHKTLDPAEMAG